MTAAASPQGATEPAPQRPNPARAPRKAAVSWGSLSAGLPERVRSLVGPKFRELGGDFARWSRRDWALLADAITAVEDATEVQHPRWEADRAALRDVRRAVEQVCWP